MIQAPPHKSTIADLDGNILAMLVYITAYVMMWIPGVSYFAWAAPLAVFLLEKRSPFIRFHALQALILTVTQIILTFVVSLILGAIVVAIIAASANPFGLTGFVFLPIISLLISLTFSVFAGIACYQAYRYFEYEIPVIGKLARKFGKF